MTTFHIFFFIENLTGKKSKISLESVLNKEYSKQLKDKTKELHAEHFRVL